MNAIDVEMAATLAKIWEKTLPPSLYSPGMLQPYGAMLPLVCYAATPDVPRYVEESRKVIRDLFDIEAEYVIYYQYMGLNAYVEIDVHYDPIKTDRGRLLSILKVLSDVKRKHRCVSTSNEEFTKTGPYYELALKLKQLLDPKGIP